MHEQGQEMISKGIPTAIFNSDTSTKQKNEEKIEITNGICKLIFMTPEYFIKSEEFVKSIRENLALTRFRGISKWGFINSKDEEVRVDDAVSSLQIDTRAKSQVKRLSGGNQQKVTIGRWVTTGFDLLLCFDPTRGIDVGTKQQIYELVREFANQGKSVLLFTSELREIQLACDRAIVIYEGKVQADLPIDKCDEENLLNAAHGIAVAK
jgi:ribose transport system ATP-binding protein